MRGTVVKLPGRGGSMPDWQPLTVCGEVYSTAIKDLIEDLSGLTPADKGAWIAEYPKARAAIYYSLSEDEREEMETLCEQWNRTGIPPGQKLK